MPPGKIQIQKLISGVIPVPFADDQLTDFFFPGRKRLIFYKAVVFLPGLGEKIFPDSQMIPVFKLLPGVSIHEKGTVGGKIQKVFS